MSNVTVNIGTGALTQHTARLERMHRSALPVAVRGALNSAAFDVKKETMPARAGREFEKRKPTFFKAKSKVDPARGFAVDGMKATVGFTGNDQAIEDLEQQEKGGDISGRAFIPMKQARVGSSWNKSVRAAARISAIKQSRVVDSKDTPGRSDKEKFVKAALFAGKGGKVIGNRTKNGNRFLFEVKTIKRKGRSAMVATVPLYAVKKGRKAKVKATHFMKESSEQSGAKLPRFFEAEARKQFNRLR